MNRPRMMSCPSTLKFDFDVTFTNTEKSRLNQTLRDPVRSNSTQDSERDDAVQSLTVGLVVTEVTRNLAIANRSRNMHTQS